MKKHLKLRGVYKLRENMVEVFLVHRSHVGYAFGNKGIDKASWFFSHQGFGIASDFAYDEEEPSTDYSYNGVRGLALPDTLGNDNPNNESCLVTLEDWKHIKECVKAYNEYEFTG